VHRRAVDHRRADRRDVEAGPLRLDEVKGGFLREGLAGAVGGSAVGARGRVVRDRVPVGFGVGVAGAGPLFQVEDGGEGGGDDDALDGGVVGVDGFQDLGGAVDGGVQEVALVVLDLGLEGGGGVDDLFGGCLAEGGVGEGREGREGAYAVDAFDGFVEGSRCGDVFDDGEGELVVVLGMRFADAVGALFRSDGTANFVAVLEELFDYMSCHEAGGSGHEDCLPSMWLCPVGQAVGQAIDLVQDLLSSILDRAHFKGLLQMYCAVCSG